MAALLIPDWLASDRSKLLLFALVVVGLFILMRVLSRRKERAHEFGSAAFLGSEVPQTGGGASGVHPVMRFEKLELRRFFMHEFDVMTGPPDPFEFVDELTAEVEHLDTGVRSTWEFTIGTPSGFARLLERKHWESFHSPEVFVLRKYDLEIVREMILEHIADVLAGRPSPPVPPAASGD